MKVFNYVLLAAGDMSGSITSGSQQLIQEVLCSIQAVWAGTAPAGTLKLQISNDNSTWVDYTGSSTTVSGDGNFMWNLISVPFRYVRVVYTRVSGIGTLVVTIGGKGV